MKPVLLDLFCRMGGATVGYQRAGFHVIGVDIEPQPGYPGDKFIQADALTVLHDLLHDRTSTSGAPRWHYPKPALIHASPPCQEANTAAMTNRKRGIADTHEQFVPRTRALLDEIGIPYVIEQLASSRKGTIRRDLTLCMDMFKSDLEPPWVQKHRSFELSTTWTYSDHFNAWHDSLELPHPMHTGKVRGWRHGEYFDGPYVAGYGSGGGKATAEELRHAMGIDWMTDRFDLCEAIPPAYTEYIGTHFLRGLN